MKSTLEFDLTNPEEQKEHLRCILSTKMAIVLWEMHNNGYKKVKHKGREIYNEGVEDTLENLRCLMEKNGININELID